MRKIDEILGEILDELGIPKKYVKPRRVRRDTRREDKSWTRVAELDQLKQD